MPLTQAQLVVLKADIDANPGEFGSIPSTPDGHLQIAEIYNTTASPDYFVWRQGVTESEVVSTTSNDGTTSREFAWSGTGGYIARSQGERDAWGRLFFPGSVNATLVNVRQAFADIFSGGGAEAANNRAHLLAISIRLARRIERLFAVAATGPGNNGAQPRGSRQNPDAMTVAGTITGQDVENARNLP